MSFTTIKPHRALSPLRALAATIVVTALSACGHPWTPTGGWQKVNDERCDPRRLESALTDQPNTAQERRDSVASYLSDCDHSLSADEPGFYQTAIMVPYLQYDYWKNPEFRDLHLLGIDGSQLEAHLLMRPGTTPRPLVIVQCGLQCDLGDSALKYIVAHLRDAGPFHLLLLGSNTSATYERQNGRVVAGGFDEGRNVLKAARYLKSSGFVDRDRISRIIVLGMSLGSHAALYAGLYNSFVTDPQGEPYISSVIAACPVVDLEKSVKRLFDGKGFLNSFMTNEFFSTLQSLVGSVPFLKTFLSEESSSQMKAMGGIPEVIARGGLDYYKHATLDPSWGLAPLENLRIEDEASYWAINRFQDFARLNRTPTFLWGAEDDPVVHVTDNLDVLADEVGADGPYTFLRSKRGYHCNFTEGYGWRAASSVIRNFVISESPELIERRVIHHHALDSLKEVARSGYIPASARRSRLQWRSTAGNRDLTIVEEFSFFCRRATPRGDTKRCTEYRYSTVPDALFGFTSAPAADVDAQRRTRWLNSNVWVWGSRLGKLDGSTRLKQVEWHDFDLDGENAL